MPFRVFVSSPVVGIEAFRRDIMQYCSAFEWKGSYEFFFFENHDNVREEGETVCEAIFRSSGKDFDAFFVFFKDRVGQGTIEELDYYQNVVRPRNPNCELWWSQIDCDQGHDQDVVDILARLHGLRGTALKTHKASPQNAKPLDLICRLAAMVS